MVKQLQVKPGADAVTVAMTVMTQDEQLRSSRMQRHPSGQGRGVVLEVIVPQLRRVPPGNVARVFTLEADQVGIETFDDTVDQIAWSHIG
jgi:hypothetical protein